jgi:hypothetical protein
MGKISSTQRLIVFMLCLLSAIFALILISKYYHFWVISLIILFFTYAFSFIITLEYRGDRFIKGILTISLGILYGSLIIGFIYDYFYIIFPKDLSVEKSEKIKDIFKYISSFIVISSSGAGGGLLANYSDQYLTD